MNPRDREFLSNYVRFSGLNHVITAVALYRAGVEADDTAIRLIQEVDLLDLEEASASARHLNQGARVQTVVIGRLLAEFVATIEDVAALAWAVRERERGLFARYLHSSVGEAVMLLDRACGVPRPTLEELLRFPAISDVKSRLPMVASAAIERDYATMPDTFAQMGNAYRQREFGMEVPAGQVGRPSDDRLHVVLELLDDPNEGSQSKGTIVEAYNKLKHRFTVMETGDQFGPGSGTRTSAATRGPCGLCTTGSYSSRRLASSWPPSPVRSQTLA